jgi:hypothetical protein
MKISRWAASRAGLRLKKMYEIFVSSDASVLRNADAHSLKNSAIPLMRLSGNGDIRLVSTRTEG